MGCNVSVLDGTLSRKKTGSFHKKHIETIQNPPTDKFDPRLPLTVRQKFSIMKSWKGIARNMSETGILMFLRYTYFTFFICLISLRFFIYVFYLVNII